MKNVKVDTSAFNRAIHAIATVTKRDAADIINRALRNVAFRAASFTPFRTAAEIEAAARRDNILIKRVARSMRGSSRAAINARAKQILAKRKSGSRVERAGWIPAIHALGGTFRGARLKPGGSASHGSANPANARKLIGRITNAYFNQLRGSGAGISARGMVNALQSAVNHVAGENIAYAKRKVAQTLRRHSV